MSNDKPFSQACENNKRYILDEIIQVFTCPKNVVEIGSGTGQHACYFSRHLPHIMWQPTDQLENLSGITQWVQHSLLTNLKLPLCLDVREIEWPITRIEGLFTANTLHIMSLDTVVVFFDRLKDYLLVNAPVVIYGPFNFNHQYTSDSNAQFDQYLQAQNPLMGIRDCEKIVDLAACAGIKLVKKVSMPANNYLLILKKIQ